MNAEIVAIGTELLLGDIADTNSQALGKAFAEYGITHLRRTTVGDNLERATNAIREALERADIVVTIGGLGPTYDDITREAIAAAVGEQLVLDEQMESSLREFTKQRGREWIDAMARQAMKPNGATLIENPVGTAPGILYEGGEGVIIAMPGPKNEFNNMLQGPVRAFFEGRAKETIVSRTLRVVGIPEISVEESLKDIMSGGNPSVAPYAKVGEVHVRITAKAETLSVAETMIRPIENTIRGRLGKAVFGTEEHDLATEVLDLLKQRHKWLATAESCTGGMLGERITNVPGSGDSYMGGFITYSNEMKARFLNVARTDLSQFGAVSEIVARQMAESVCKVTGADYGIGITGLAGPGGETEGKPIGLVYIAIHSPRGTEVRENHFTGDRETIKYRSTQSALAMLRDELLSQ